MAKMTKFAVGVRNDMLSWLRRINGAYEEDDLSASAPPTTAGETPVAAVIGMGFLGTRIAAELLLLGTKVQVYDRAVAQFGEQEGQQSLDKQIHQVLDECHKRELLQMAGASAPSSSKGPWDLYDGEDPVRVLWSSSIAEACCGVDIVIEAVPDNVDIKTAVFEEVVQGAPKEALLATSTLSIPLAFLHQAVARRLGIGSRKVVEHRLIGLRFLAPVVFIAFVEVTVTQAQAGLGCRDRVLDLLTLWGKSAFNCDVQGAAEAADGPQEGVGRARLRLDHETALRRQAIEARVRGAHRSGPDAVSALTHTEQECCICMGEPAVIKNVICGHVALCKNCALILKAKKMGCPMCRARFLPDAHASI